VRRPEKVFCHAQRSRVNSVLLFALSDGVSKSLFWSTTDLGCAVNVFSCPCMFLRTRSRNAQFLRGFRECGTGCAVAQPTDRFFDRGFFSQSFPRKNKYYRSCLCEETLANHYFPLRCLSAGERAVGGSPWPRYPSFSKVRFFRKRGDFGCARKSTLMSSGISRAPTIVGCRS
jgi:hypothetical protein